MPVAIETDIDLPDRLEAVEIALTCEGVAFIAFTLDLWLDQEKIKQIKEQGTQNDCGEFFQTEDARTLRGLTVVCRGVVGAAVPAHVRLRLAFRCDNKLYRSAPADIDISSADSSDVFRIRCPIV